MLEIDVNEADAGLLEHADRGLVGLGPLADTMALETTVDGAARELGVETAAHDLDDIVERQRKPRAQFADERLLH
jgi:hypothetical protein